MPLLDELDTSSNIKHNIYVSKKTMYVNETFKNHNIIFCEPSNDLFYENAMTIKVSDHLYVDSIQMPDNVRFEFQMMEDRQQLTIRVETTEDSKIEQFSIYSYADIFINFMFLTEYIPEDIIHLIEARNCRIYTYEITDKIKKLIDNPEKLDQREVVYYCLSDKEVKCENYNSVKKLKYINSTSYILNNDYNIYLIVDTSKPEVIYRDHKFNSFWTQYIHIIGMTGSDLTFYTSRRSSDGEYYAIIQPDCIEVQYAIYEGEGKFTLVTSSNISLYATTNKNKIDFTLKSENPYYLKHSYIYPLKNDTCFELDNKIKVHEYSLYHGSKCLSGYFEKGKFLSDEELITYNVTVDKLKETEFDYVNYYFKEGVHEIPVTWKRHCRFHGVNPSKTHFIFNDVYYYDGERIDNFINVNYFPSSSFNNITIRPARHLYLYHFKSIYFPQHLEKYTIEVDHNFTMDGYGKSNKLDDDEISRDQCRITGKGTIFFYNSEFMRQVKLFCQIDDTINLEYNSTIPYYTICIGQSSLEKCKSKVTDIKNLQDRDWIWMRNVNTTRYVYSSYRHYITEKLNLLDDHYDSLTVTGNCVLTVNYEHYRGHIYQNGYEDIEVQSPTAKLIVLFTEYHYTPGVYGKQAFRVYPYEGQVQFDLQFKFYYEYVKLYMKYYYKFNEKSIKLSGKSLIYYREPMKSKLSIFQIVESNNVAFSVNHDGLYNQILFSNEPIESDNLYDFVHCSTIDDFKKYDAVNVHTYIYLNFSMDLYSNSYYCRYFHFIDNVNASINLPDEAVLVIYNQRFEIFYKKTNVLLYFTSNETKFSFNLHPTFILDTAEFNPSIIPKIEITSSYLYVEIIPYPFIRKLTRDYQFFINDFIYIGSPAPQYLNGLFGQTLINYSNSWTYYHMSDEGRSLYGSFPSYKLENYEIDDWNLSYKCVIAVGKNDVLTIPTNWSYTHKIYILQGDDRFVINRPENLSYYTDGLVINDKFKVIAGNLNITVPEELTINVELIESSLVKRFMYWAYLICSENTKTKVYTGSIYVENQYSWRYDVKFYGYGYPNDLTIISKNSTELGDFQSVLYLYSKYNVKYRFAYDSICFCNSYNCHLLCTGKYFLVKDLTTLYEVVNDYPDLSIDVFSDLYISHPTGNRFNFIIKDRFVRIGFPASPDSIVIADNNTVQFNYSDSTFYEVKNKASIYVYLKDKLDLKIKANTNSIIDFYLESDVFATVSSIEKTNFSIYVSNYYYHLYTEDDENLYEDIFNGTLEPYIKVCAYDNDASSLCTYEKKELIKNVFTDFFDYNVVEIALSSSPCSINLPSITNKINVNILPIESSVLSLLVASNVKITPSYVYVNDCWNFTGEIKVLKINLDLDSTLSVVDEMTAPIVLQLTNTHSSIDLRDFDDQKTSQITILKHGNERNEIIVYGNDENFENFMKSIVKHENISIIRNGKQKYLCICNNIELCNKCKEGVNGLITTSKNVKSDPGEDVKIRVFSDIEMSSHVFINEHDVFIDSNFNLILTNVYKVNQNIEKGLKVDNLVFINGSNLLLKPRDISLDIEMREEEMGPYFTIDMNTYLRLNVTNIENQNIKSSRLHVTGFGELNAYDYPFSRIRPVRTVKVIKGIYVICNSRAGNDACSYESVHRYKRLGNSDFFRPEFDQNSKILVILHSYTSNLRVKSDVFKYQKVEFIRNYFTANLLENQNKLVIESTNSILSSENLTELSGSNGGASFDNKDSDLFVVGIDEYLTIKQEGNVSLNSFTIQPMSEKVTIIVDDSVEIEKQKLKIESDKKVSINVLTNKNVQGDSILNGFIEADVDKVSIFLNNKDIRKPKKGLPIGAIIGIVVGCVVVVAAIVVIIVIFIVKHKTPKEKSVISDVNNELSDSTF